MISTAKQECRFNARGGSLWRVLSLASIRTAGTNQNALKSVVRPLASQIAAPRMPKPLRMEKSKKGLGLPPAIRKSWKEIINPLPPPPYGRGRGYFFPTLFRGGGGWKKTWKEIIIVFFSMPKTLSIKA